MGKSLRLFPVCSAALTLAFAAPKKKAQKISLNEFLGDSGKYSVQTLQKGYWNVSAQR